MLILCSWSVSGFLISFSSPQAKSVEIKDRKDDLGEIEDLGGQMEEQLILDNK